MLHVIATITTKPGARAEVLRAFDRLLPPVLEEPGCISYGSAVDRGFAGNPAKLGPDTFVVIEQWASSEAVQAHSASAHVASFRRETSGLIEEMIVQVLTPREP